MPHYNLPLNQSPNAQLKYYKFGINIITQIGPSTSKPPNHRPNQTNPNKPTPTNKPLRNKPPLSSLPNTNQSRHKTKPNTPNKIKTNGGIILALDGVQPEKGNQTYGS